MNVLDPFEVARVSVWLLEPFAWMTKAEVKANLASIGPELNRAEYTLYVKVIEESSFKAVLNEKPPSKTELITLPIPHIGDIIPPDIFPARKHPDVRIARRASTIAALARVISERKVTKWLRTTLLTQARRLERLAADRLADFAGMPDEGDEGIESKD